MRDGEGADKSLMGAKPDIPNRPDNKRTHDTKNPKHDVASHLGFYSTGRKGAGFR